jgi:uncharacterized protein (DUF2147 family)
MRTAALVLSIMGLTFGPAAAGDASGAWTRDDGEAGIQIARCGEALCGTIAWVKAPAGKPDIGRRVFWDMIPDSDTTWQGKAFNPEDGRTYSGKLSLNGSIMTTSGCVLGGLFCKSVTWKRAK